MNKVYIITGSAGEYDDYRTWDVCAFLLENRAASFAHRLNCLIAYNKSFNKKMYNFEKSLMEQNHNPKYNSAAAMEKYKEENYKPDSDLIELVSLVKANENDISFSVEELEIKQ